MDLHHIFFEETRKKILSMTTEKDMTITDIAKNLGLTKATVSHHVKLLHECGLLKVTRKEIQGNLIKKYYRSVFGDINPLNRVEEIIISKTKGELDEYLLLKGFFRSLNVINLQMGEEMFLKKLGFDIGYYILADLIDEDDEIHEGLIKIWKKFRLGKMDEIDEKTLSVEDCYLCSDLPEVGYTYCKPDEGVIEGILLKKTGKRYKVREVSCWGTGDEKCVFKIF